MARIIAAAFAGRLLVTSSVRLSPDSFPSRGSRFSQVTTAERVSAAVTYAPRLI